MAYPYRNDLLAPYLALPQGDKVQAECKLLSHLISLDVQTSLSITTDVWIDGDGGLRSKTTVCHSG
jgi:glutamine synthetase